MQTLVLLCAVFSVLLTARAEVLHNFRQCRTFFYKKTVPDLGASQANVARICQRLNNRYHFATLYDTTHRIAVYSAYIFMNPNEQGKGNACQYWCIEPQLVDRNYEKDMMEEGDVKRRHPGVDLGVNQALDGDYRDTVYDRGHLNPDSHNTGESKDATYTLTNIVPQTKNLNQHAWRDYENKLTALFEQCSQVFVLVGAIPSENNWIVKNKVNRVNIPRLVWNAYCCVDNNGKPILSGGAIAQNTDQSTVRELTLEKLKKVLRLHSNQVLFKNNCQ